MRQSRTQSSPRAAVLVQVFCRTSHKIHGRRNGYIGPLPVVDVPRNALAKALKVREELASETQSSRVAKGSSLGRGSHT